MERRPGRLERPADRRAGHAGPERPAQPVLAACHERRGDREPRSRPSAGPWRPTRTIWPPASPWRTPSLDAGRPGRPQGIPGRRPSRPLAGARGSGHVRPLRPAWARRVRRPGRRVEGGRGAAAKFRQQNPGPVEPAVLQADAWPPGATSPGPSGAPRAERPPARATRGCGLPWPAISTRGRGTLAAAQVVSEGQLAAGESVELRLARARVWADDLQPGREQRMAQLEDLPRPPATPSGPGCCPASPTCTRPSATMPGGCGCWPTWPSRDGTDLASRKALYALALGPETGGARAVAGRVGPGRGAGGHVSALLDGAGAPRHRRRPRPAGRTGGWRDQAVVRTADMADAHSLARHRRRTAPRRGRGGQALRGGRRPRPDGPVRRKRALALLPPGAARTTRPAGRWSAWRPTPAFTPPRFRAVVEGAIPRAAAGRPWPSACLASRAIQAEPRAVSGRAAAEGAGRDGRGIALYRQATEASRPSPTAGRPACSPSARLGRARSTRRRRSPRRPSTARRSSASVRMRGGRPGARAPDWPPDRRPTTAALTRKPASGLRSPRPAGGRRPRPHGRRRRQGVRPADAAWARRTLAALTAAPRARPPEAGCDRAPCAREGPPAIGGGPLAGGGPVRRPADRQPATTGRVGPRRDDRPAHGHHQGRPATANDWYQLAQLHAAAATTGRPRMSARAHRREPKKPVLPVLWSSTTW